jgi:hypothetical protein
VTAQETAPAGRGALLVAITTILGLIGFLVCAVRHTCMAGHMQHPPYVATDHALDVAWAAMILIAAWRAPKTPLKRSRLFAALLILIATLRFLSTWLGHFGLLACSLAELFSLLASVYLAIVAIHLFWRTLRSPLPPQP